MISLICSNFVFQALRVFMELLVIRGILTFVFCMPKIELADLGIFLFLFFYLITELAAATLVRVPVIPFAMRSLILALLIYHFCWIYMCTLKLIIVMIIKTAVLNFSRNF